MNSIHLCINYDNKKNKIVTLFSAEINGAVITDREGRLVFWDQGKSQFSDIPSSITEDLSAAFDIIDSVNDQVLKYIASQD